MGIETAAILSYAATAAQVVGAVGAAYGAVQSAKGKPQMAIPKPEKPPQATKTPDRNAALGANAAAALGGNSGTFLTGAGGVNPGSLNLGRNTLLGQ